MQLNHCCTVEPVTWLRQRHLSSNSNVRNMRRMDVILRSLVAERWLKGSCDLDRVYLQHVRARVTARNDAMHSYSAGRLMLYRSLFRSIRANGFHWSERPLEVDRDWGLLDGSHRLALALVLHESRVTLLQTCQAPRVTDNNRFSLLWMQVHVPHYVRFVNRTVHALFDQGAWPAGLAATEARRAAAHARRNGKTGHCD